MKTDLKFMAKKISLDQHVPEHLAGLRLDQAAAALFPDYSRARLQQWIKQGELTVDGARAKPSVRLAGGEILCIEAQMLLAGEVLPEDIPLDILYEDDHLLVVNKPAGLVVHPAAGNWDGTLQNALLNFDQDMDALPRSGIVHRLDKDTSGIMVVARSLKAHASLVDQLQTRSMGRIYEAVVKGETPPAGTVAAPIDRNPRERKKMAVVEGGRAATSHYRLIQRLPGSSHIEVSLESGRTHQIRVHMTHIGYPIVADLLYGRGPIRQKGLSTAAVVAINGFPRQALHARTLKLVHPDSTEKCEFHAPLAEDIKGLIETLKGSYD
ncbi:MAG: 23S rRNA pseudouridine(1911/1915/1917) synthase RluD [Gammaproteobacteria bacterium]|nr:MAG: 23S rRNA pseudouridine(1911/1915/1917) synthase RluD [Gammaproteobacteria bacterium]